MDNKSKSVKNILAFLIISFMSFIGILTETSLNVTFPTLMKEFQVNLATVQWMTTGYLLMIAVLMSASSFLNRRFTAKSQFIFACSAFILGSFLCLTATNFPILLAGRLFSALGAGITTPLMFNLIIEVFPKSEWGFFMGTAGLVISMAPTLGPTFGGSVTFYLSWRAIFIIVMILAAIILIIGSLVIGQYHPVAKFSFDWTGFVSLAVAMIFLVISLNQVSSGHLHLFLLLLLVAIFAFIYFYYHTQKIKNKFLNLDVFENKAFIWGILAYFLLQLVNIGISFVLPNYLQIVGKQNALIAGLALLPGNIIAALLNPLFGKIYDDFGAKLLLFLGSFMMMLGCILLTIIGLNWGLALVMITYGILVIGHRMSFSNTLASSISLQPAKLHADATALCQTAQQLAGALGTSILAIIISFFQNQDGNYLRETSLGCQVAFLASFIFSGIILVAEYLLLKKQH